jgi:hypothetical protein
MDRFWVRRAAITCVVAVLVTACGSAATASPSSTVGAKPSPTASATASPSPVAATPSPTATPTATPFVLPPVDSIINPSPSERPQTPITTQQLKDDVAKLITIPNSGLLANDIGNINKYLQTCTDPNSDRLPACISLVVGAYHGTATMPFLSPDAHQALYRVAFDGFWWAIGANGIGPSAEPAITSVLQASN